MKFSYSLLKQLVPAVKSKKELLEKLDFYALEAEDLGRDVLDVSVTPNRFSDAASHWGLAREISAILGKKFKIPEPRNPVPKKSKKVLNVSVKEKKLCPRYEAQCFEDVKVGPSPKWMQKILRDCGLRPVNNVVDIMNYAMLEVGQPLHAFDYDKLTAAGDSKTIIVRLAKAGEKIKTLDDKTYNLTDKVLVIADEKKPIAIAGIKGGKDTEIDKKTKRIIIEAANFSGADVYRSSRFLNLQTDASLRFSHNLNPELPELGLNRAAELLTGLVEAKPGPVIDANFTKSRKTIIRVDLERLNKLIGANLDFKTARNNLELLGFGIKVPAGSANRYPINQFLVSPPALREDVETFEDVAEEIVRLYGLNRVSVAAPKIHLIPSGFEDQIVLKDKIRKILIGFGLSEVYNYSFISREEGKKFVFGRELIELENPVSEKSCYMRPSLAAGFLKNVEDNFRFQNEVRIFEIGETFAKEDKGKITERLILGIALASKEKETFFELKGLVSVLFKKIGLVDYFLVEPGDKQNDWVRDFTGNFLDDKTVLKIESGDAVFGYLGRLKSGFGRGKVNLLEIDLDVLLKLVSEEHEYRALPKYPSVMRDISILINDLTKIGDIMQAIQEVNKKYIDDVDLIDEYKNSYTFRIIFQAQDRTLTDAEVNREMEKITGILRSRFKATIR